MYLQVLIDLSTAHLDNESEWYIMTTREESLAAQLVSLYFINVIYKESKYQISTYFLLLLYMNVKTNFSFPRCLC